MLPNLRLLVIKVFTKLRDNSVNVLLDWVCIGLGHFFPNNKLPDTDLAVRWVYGPWVCLHIPKMATALEGNGLGGAEALSPLFDFGSRFVECDLKRRHARLSHNLLHQFFIGVLSKITILKPINFLAQSVGR